jgi:hypothetical protein
MEYERKLYQKNLLDVEFAQTVIHDQRMTQQKTLQSTS